MQIKLTAEPQYPSLVRNRQMLSPLPDPAAAASAPLIEWIAHRGGAVTVEEVAHGLRVYRSMSDLADKNLDALANGEKQEWRYDGSSGHTPRCFYLHNTFTVTTSYENPTESEVRGDGDTGDTPNLNRGYRGKS